MKWRHSSASRSSDAGPALRVRRGAAYVTELRDVLVLAHRLLEQAGVDHALIGAMALGNLGVHRATMDVDLLVDGRRAGQARSALLNGGFLLQAETSEVLQFGGIGALDLLLAHRESSQAMLAHARSIPGLGIKCLDAEDIIGLKIQAWVNDPKRKRQDQADVIALLRIRADLDWDRIRRYAELFDEWSTVQELRNEAGI